MVCAIGSHAHSKFGENRKVLYRAPRGLRGGSNIHNVSRRMPGKISLKGGPAIGQDPLRVSKLRIVPPKDITGQR
jgi:hypothetical protein